MHRLFCGLALLFCSIVLTAETRDAASTKKWREDLAVFRTELPKRHHRDFFFNLPRQEFNALIDALDAEVPRLADHEIKVRLAAIVARLGDRHGHTRVLLTGPSAGFHFLPLNLHVYSDGLYIRAASPEYESVVGTRVESIGGTPIEEALRRVRTVTPGDNAISRIEYAQELVAVPEILRALGVVRDGAPGDPVSMEVVRGDGSRATVEVAPLASLQNVTWVDMRRHVTQRPLYRKYPPANPAAEYIPAKKYWFEYLPDSKLLYVHYAAVMDDTDRKLADFFREVFAFADAHEVEKFVIDVRHNGGGNNTLNRPIFHDLIRRSETIARRGRFFVLIGRQTFSAAQNFINFLDAHTDVTFVGEPSGGSPNHYGDSTRFTLPNSGLIVRASTLWWQDSSPTDTRKWIAPHIAVDVSAADDLAGRDPALEAILRYTPETPLAVQLREAYLRGGKSEAAAALTAWRDDPRHKYLTTEEELTQLGVAYFTEKQPDAAVAIFELNAEAHPQS
jgi:C-terminal processing protease CtpA/Prc